MIPRLPYWTSVLLVAGCSLIDPPPERASGSDLCDRLERLDCSSDLKGYRDTGFDGVPDTACIIADDTCDSCPTHWSNVFAAAEDANCDPEIGVAFECMWMDSTPDDDGACLNSCYAQVDDLLACAFPTGNPGEAACLRAAGALTALPCNEGAPGQSEAEIAEFCSGVPAGCAEFWNGVADTAACEAFGPGGEEFPTWDFEQFPPDTQVDGFGCTEPRPQNP